MSRRISAKRVRTTVRRIAFVRRSAMIIGMALIGWTIAMGVRHAGPFFERLLEVKEVTVEGVRHVDKQEVVDLVKLKPGTPLYLIVSSGIKERVESHPWIKEAEVARVPFHELRISVVERTPAAVVRAGSENFLSDGEGHVLALLSHADDHSLPMVTGVDPRALLRGDEVVRRAIVSGIELAKLVGKTYKGRLRVHAENPSNLVASVRGVRFHFGEEPVGHQWSRFQQVKSAVKTVDFDGYGDIVNDVDLRFKNRVVVRERG